MGGVWTTADYALIVSLCSVGISLFGFVWNVWSKFIYPKPKLTVHLSDILAFDVESPSDEMVDRALRLNAVNHGPGPITITQTTGRLKRNQFWRRPNWAVFKTYGRWPHDKTSFHIGGFGLPTKLEVGEGMDQFLRPHENHYREMVKFGFTDSFGRTHWATTKSVKQAKTSWLTRETA